MRYLYHTHGLDYALSDEFFLDLARELTELFARAGIPAEPTRRWEAKLRRRGDGL